jgi:hypothetical protein
MHALVLLLAFAPIGAGPVYAVREHADVPITNINSQTRRFFVAFPTGGGQALSVSAKTWLMQDNEEAKFEDLRVGQRVHVWFIPRGGQAVAIEILPPKPTGGKSS